MTQDNKQNKEFNEDKIKAEEIGKKIPKNLGLKELNVPHEQQKKLSKKVDQEIAEKVKKEVEDQKIDTDLQKQKIIAIAASEAKKDQIKKNQIGQALQKKTQISKRYKQIMAQKQQLKERMGTIQAQQQAQAMMRQQQQQQAQASAKQQHQKSIQSLNNQIKKYKDMAQMATSPATGIAKKATEKAFGKIPVLGGMAAGAVGLAGAAGGFILLID